MAGLTVLSLPLLLSAPRRFYFDLSVYLSVASNLLEGRGFVLPNGYPSLSSHPILFPSILAFLLGITNGSALAAVRLLSIFSILIIWAVYALGRHLFGRWAGVLGAVLAAFMVVLRRYSNPARIDTLAAFLLIVCLLFIWLSYRQRGTWLILAGISMGMAFLQKEATVFWAPVPWLLYLIDWRYRCKVRLIELWIYTALVAVPIAWWMVWSYRWGGRMFPLSAELTALAIRWGGLALLAVALSSLLFWLAENRVSWFGQICKSQGWRRAWLIVLLVAAVLGSPFLTLFRGNWAQVALPWTQIPAYVMKYSDDFPAFALVIVACCAMIALAIWKGTPSSIFSTLFLVPGFALFASIAQSGYATRQVLGAILLAYVVFAGSLSLGVKWLQKRYPGRAIRGLGIVGAVVFGLWFIRDQTAAFERFEGVSYLQMGPADAGWFHGETLLPVADWVEENLPPGTPLLTSYWMTYGLGFETEGRYPIYAMPMSKALDSVRPEEPFTRGGYTMRARYPVSYEKTVSPEEIIFFDYSTAGSSYYFLMEKQLLAWIEELGIDYVILAGDYLFKSMPYTDYFALNGAFELVLEANYEPSMPVYVFRVDRSKLHPQGQYPLVISPLALERMAAESEEGWDIEQLADYFPRAISLDPLEKEDAKLAATVARRYLETERFTPALDLYRKVGAVAPLFLTGLLVREPQEPWDHLEQCAMHLASERMDEASAVCNHAATILPESSMPRIALGQIAMSQHQLQLAMDHYQKAAELYASSEAYLGLGQAYSLDGQFEEALQAYQQAIAIEPSNQLARMHVTETEALQAQAEGRWDESLMAYREATDLYPVYWPTTLPGDPVARQPDTGDAELHILDLDPSVEQNIFVIDRRPMRVLLSPSADYQVTIPPTATLSLSLGFSPEVWQLGKGDGAQFDLFVDDGRARWHPLSVYIDPKNIPQDRQWHDHQIDLSRWAGQTVTLGFVIGPGPNGNDLYDWAGWGEPRILQPVAHDFLTELPNAEMGERDQDLVRADVLAIDYDSRPILFQHPSSRVTYRVEIPEAAGLRFGLGMDPIVWSPDKGDGAEYSIHMAYAGDPDSSWQVFSRYLDPKGNPSDRRWFDFILDLSVYGGQTMDIVFESLPGSAGDTMFDWGGWSRLIMVANDALLLKSPRGGGAHSAADSIGSLELVEPPPHR
jgi:tetratricopeptide (TPR) repeat protein/4-amino-4-deoxy-L-arabinose transferase-like glycosyltransferase